MKEYWTALASLMGTYAFVQSIINSLLPPEFRHSAGKFSARLFRYFSSYCYYDIAEVDGVSTNDLYNAVQVYLSGSASVSGTRLSLTRSPNSSAFTFNLSNNDHLLDNFNGAVAWWEHRVTQRQSQSFSWRPTSDEKRSFTLKIKKKDKPAILPAYFDHIMESAAEIRRKSKDRLLYTNSRGGSVDSRGRSWESVPFKHPSTFQTLAMDPVLKDEIIADLREFTDGKAFYESTGRAWKRGYLLHGPPGTGKSSMIAAMANHLGYDVYDLELTEVNTNSDLRKLLMKTTAKSIIVIEDIDCSLELTNRSSGEKKKAAAPGKPAGQNSPEEAAPVRTITLSGLLNFTDGLWSCCGSERIFVFTTNHVERLDPALLRSGRMDMHIFMSHCSFPALKILVKNYLGSRDDDGEGEKKLWMELEEVIGEAEMTPADISEVLIKNRRRGRRRALEELLQALKGRAEERKAAPAKKMDAGDEVEVIGEAEMTPADISEVLIKNRRRGRRRALEELLQALKGRAEERKAAPAKKMDAGDEAVVVEEEKRELESPEHGGENNAQLSSMGAGNASKEENVSKEENAQVLTV
ncbi:hypothetical protein J5N97_026796 [Dioscorea zingiberensis]|uniref:AAA+ ATPase domain-containing protein n=1 Tax=Dioscorea zingiberensis TaxID=325984 RepID=A0A9D5H713_9LILI|nr:hypothetical protein J5N97_026796 [Dioscorea zingiberensis]